MESARSQTRIQQADLWPQITAGSTLERSRTPADLSPSGKVMAANTVQASVQARWELDLWGRVHNLEASALARWLASDEARRAVALTVVAEVAHTWLLGRDLDERIALARRTTASRRDSARIARRRYEVGAAPRLDMTQADTLLGQAESAVIALEQRRDETLHALALLVGRPVEDTVVPLSALDAVVVRDLPPGVPSDLLEQRPDIRAAESRLRAAEADIGVARAAFFPRIALTGSMGTASAALDGLFSPGSGAWTLAESILTPVFDAGRLHGALSDAKAQRAAAVADYERTVQGAFRDVADALAARHWLGRQVEAQNRTLAALTERARLSDLRYRNGAAPHLEVLEAQRDLFAIEQTLIETRRARLSSEVTLFTALGGGPDAPSAPPTPVFETPTGTTP
ncbi:RND efflux system, outer membrane lipoprotein,NodT [Pararhodospirillum photometricum DSM 122]|uniref:RND efflux system, outer membrane lipoprotein,NodT n=1 Tax=Pararhodospirillum photometricum DSM 122 TaxID=1150469 RepID=H6SPV4_PARPM|nr:RND efflux system, outer membrane lipoprotein,NodT [Pararhodospirillum photometricum DSM 122]